MRQRSPSKNLHDKVQQLKNNSHLSFHYLAKVLKILPLPPEDRTLDDIALLMEATKDFAFFGKFHEKGEQNLHEQCCQHLHVEHYTKGSVVIRQGDEGDKMFIVLSGELDVYTMKTELESKQYHQDQLEKENSCPAEIPEPKKSVSNLSNKSRSPRRQKMATQKESSIPSLPTEEDASPTGDYGRKATEGDIESDKSVSDGRSSPFLYTRLRKLKPSRRESSKPGTIKMIDVRELAYFASLELLKENKELLWDGPCHLKFLNTIKSGSVLGEMALTTRKKRGATVIAMEDCILGVLRREDFNRILQTYEKRELENMLDFFRNALKVHLSQAGMIKLSKMFQEEKATFRQTVFHEGTHADGFYIVKSGEILTYKSVKYPVEDPTKQASLPKRIEDKTNGKREIQAVKKFGLKYPIKTLFEGQLLGEEILIGKEKRVFTAVCQSETATLLYISRERFERFFSRLKDMDVPLLQKISADYDLVEERLTGIDQYVQNFIEVSRPPVPLNQNLNYSQRVSTEKIEPLHNALSNREGNPSVEKKMLMPQLDPVSSIFILSEIQTPKFSKSTTAVQDKGFLRCHKTNAEALEVSCDTVKHVTGSNEKLLSSMMKNYNPTGDPFILKEYPNISAKDRTLSYRKCRSLTPENREKFFEDLHTARKTVLPFSLKSKEENRVSLSSRCRRLLKRVCDTGKSGSKKKSSSPVPLSDRSRGSQRELKEKSLIQNLPMRSVSTPSLSLPKGSLLSIVMLKGKNQPEQSPVCNVSTYTTCKTPSIANDFEVSSFLRWSEKEKGAFSSVVVNGSDKYNSLLAAFSERHSNGSMVMDDNDRLSHVSFPLPEEKLADASMLKLKRRKSLEGTGGRSYRKKKQLNLIIKGKPGHDMQVIEEENPNTPNNLKTVQIPQKPEKRAVSRERRFYGPGGVAMPEQEKLVKSTMHSMFRFRNIEGLRRNRRPGTVRTESSEQTDNSLKIVDLEMRKTARI